MIFNYFYIPIKASMKKTFLYLLFIATGLITHAQIAQPTLSLKTAEDSMTYAIGILYYDAIRTELVEKFNISINTETFIRGIRDNSSGNPGFTMEEANSIVTRYAMKIEAQLAEKEKEAGEKFLLDNLHRDGIHVTESGLQYEIVTMGTGKKPIPQDKVKVHYVGNLTNGTKFDSSIDRGEPVEVGLNEVILGWKEGLQLMPVGSKFRFYMPSELGYGRNAAGVIKPNSVLIFEIELLDIMN